MLAACGEHIGIAGALPMESPPSQASELVERLFELTLALFRVTDCIREPKPEKRELRGRAYRILRRMYHLEIGPSEDLGAMVLEIRAGIKDLDRALSEAQKRWRVHPVNFQVLRREYGCFSSALAVNATAAEARPTPLPLVSHPRQVEILGYLQAHGEAAVPELLAIFAGGGVSRRTLERDLSFLLQTRALRRLGDKRWARYAPNGRTTQNVV